MPEYMKDFKCIGADCDDNCCHGSISIDRDTYQKYGSIGDRVLRESITKQLQKNKLQTAGFVDYSFIENEAYCCFLDSSMRCKIHKELGEKYLSCACYTVPRKINMLDNRVEKSCNLYCPHAARQVLLNPDVMEFIEEEGFENSKNAITLKYTKREIDSIQPGFNEIRELVIDILQFREYGFSDRMIILCLFLNSLENVNAAGDFGEIANLISNYRNRIQSTDFKQEIANIKDNAEGNIVDFIKLANDLFIENTKTKNGNQYNECIKLYEEGIYSESEIKLEKVINAYNIYFAPYISNHQFIFEHFFVNYFFKEAFPLRKGRSVMEELGLLVFYYFVLNLTLVGISGNLKKLDDSVVIKYIHTFSRIIDVRADFEVYILKQLKTANFLSYSSLIYALCTF